MSKKEYFPSNKYKIKLVSKADTFFRLCVYDYYIKGGTKIINDSFDAGKKYFDKASINYLSKSPIDGKVIDMFQYSNNPECTFKLILPVKKKIYRPFQKI